MSKRIVIVGGVAAGASAAAKARRTSEDVEIVLVEAGEYISFANCGLPYYVGGDIPQRESLFVVNARTFAERFAIDLRTRTRATSVDPGARRVTLAGANGDSEEIDYHRLILATGTVAVNPPIEGLHRDNIFAVRTVPDVDAISDFLAADIIGESDAGPSERALVIGGGYIGLETAEQLLQRGIMVTLVEMADQVMLAMDPEMSLPVQAALEEAGCRILLRDPVARIDEMSKGECVAETVSGERIPFDIGIVAVGVRPNVELARAAGLTLGQTGAIAVDSFQRTSDPSIYAAGDNSEAMHLVLNKPVNIPLAGPANKAGRAAGANAALDLMDVPEGDPRRLELKGVLGTAGVRVCGVLAAVTGLTEKRAVAEGLACQSLYIRGMSHAGYYPDAQPLLLKVLYDPETGRLLGAQAVGREGADKRVDVLATAITAKMTIEDLEQLDLAYAPPFGSAKDLEILAGFAGANARRGVMPSMTPAELLDELAGPTPPAVVDTRTDKEFAEGHLDEAINIPTDELRERIDEVPAGPVAVHCASGYRSYVAQRILINRGRDDVRNVVGGWLMLREVMRTRTP
jgi:NADPH-dependent 2,4-dienoyl-CoA reductase/sulfur reductase-like enzyme/rhodanese-related sulfurtransferase